MSQMSPITTVESKPNRFFPARPSRANFPIGSAINNAQHGNNSNRCRSRPEKIRRGDSPMSIFSIWPRSNSAQPLSEDDRDNILKYSRGLDEVRGSHDLRRTTNLSSATSFPIDLKKRGVIFQPLERAMVEHADLFRKYFMSHRSEAWLGQVRRAAQSTAFRREHFCSCRADVEIELPIEIFHWLRHDNMSVFPHLLLVADELAKVTVIEHFRSCDRARGRLRLRRERSHRRPWREGDLRVRAELGETTSIALQMNSTMVDHDASAMSLNLHLGARYSRFESLSRLIGEGGRSDLLAVAVAKHQQEFDARTLQDHVSPHTASDLLYKNALDDRARTIFGGLIRVEPHAHFTDAYQKVRNLLLSDDAEANSMPGLEILADNVRCTHGATSGQIDEDELFYLRTRGIPTKVAQRLIVTGFLDEVIQRLDHPAIAEHLHRLDRREICAKIAAESRYVPVLSRRFE